MTGIKNKILIVGGTGFVGEYLVNLLKGDGNVSVRVLYSGQSPTNKSPAINYHEIDLSKPIKVISIKQDFKSFDTAVIMTQPNPKISKNIIKTFKAAKNLRKIVFISTILVYPDSEKKLSENVAPKPITSYERGKIFEESLFKKYAQSRDIKLSIVRLANVYGSAKNRGVINYLFRSVLDKKVFVVNGDGRQKRDYIFVEDAVRFIKFLIFSGQKNLVEIFNVCTGQGYTIKDLIKLIKKVTKKDLNISYGKPIREKVTIVGDNKKILRISEIRLSYNIASGLKKTYLNYKHERI